jgi:hypothetical protein
MSPIIRKHCCKLNARELDKIGLSKYDIDLECDLDDIDEWVWS